MYGKRTRAALFVDFDNIYLGLTRIDPYAAEVFATEPARWITWLERGLVGARAEGVEGAPSTAVLVRKCYLNPKTFHKYRPYFTRAAFEVVDCPPLTAQGKTSSDIRMVMDILDALSHPTRFEEFVIMSGDADFTPVLLRLRAHDRRTVVVAVGHAAAAYTAACDQVMPDDRFIADALGITSADEALSYTGAGSAAAGTRGSGSDAPPPMPTRIAAGDGPSTPRSTSGEGDQGPLLAQIAEAVYQATRAAGQLPARSLPRIYLRFPEFSASKDWLGFRGLRALTEETLRREPRLRLIDTDAESWFLVALPVTEEAPLEARSHALRASIVRVVRSYVTNSPGPVTLASASHEVLRRLGSEVVDEHWGEAGSLRDLLLDVADPALVVLERDGVEMLADPGRHRLLSPDTEETTPTAVADLPASVQRIRQITGAPSLPSIEFAAVFQVLSEVLSERSFHLGVASKLARDRLAERSCSASRVAVTLVVRGIIHGGLPLYDAPRAWPPRVLGHAFLRNVLALCEVAQLSLTSEERNELERWLLGALPPDEHTPASGIPLSAAFLPPSTAVPKSVRTSPQGGTPAE
ncbi:NYN domain-containing protein [Chondromyces crocatus]|nr:NYN domain-containing protein [Chondromyces crocatus]